MTSALTLCALLLGACAAPDQSAPQAQPDPWQQARAQMVREQLASPADSRTPVTNARVLAAMARVERHRFVPSNWREQAYRDTPLPIGFEQTISQPYIVAIMTELLQPKPGDVVLEVGTGSGYQAAVLGELVRQVYSIEIVEPLAVRAAKDLQAAGYRNIEVRAGDGYAGWPKQAPFDSIIVTAAPDHVPAPLVEQLKVGGRLVIPVGPQGWQGQELVVLEKQADGSTRRTAVLPVRFVPLTRSPDGKAVAP